MSTRQPFRTRMLLHLVIACILLSGVFAAGSTSLHAQAEGSFPSEHFGYVIGWQAPWQELQRTITPEHEALILEDGNRMASFVTMAANGGDGSLDTADEVFDFIVDGLDAGVDDAVVIDEDPSAAIPWAELRFTCPLGPAGSFVEVFTLQTADAYLVTIVESPIDEFEEALANAAGTITLDGAPFLAQQRAGHAQEDPAGEEGGGLWDDMNLDLPLSVTASYAGGPSHTGEQPGPAPSNEPEEIWAFETGDSFVGVTPITVVLDDGLVFTSSNAVYALDLSTGEEVWSYTADLGFVSPVAVADGALYAAGEDGSVYAFETATGDVIWETTLTEMAAVDGGPLIDGDTLYVTSWDGNAYALDLERGDVLWDAPLGGIPSGQPAFADGLLVVAGPPYGNGAFNGLLAFDAASGDRAWAFAIDVPIFPAPVIADGRVYVSGDEGLYAADLENGGELWLVDTGAPVASAPAVVDGVAYVVNDDAVLGAYDARSGEEIWTTEVDGSGLGGITVTTTEDGDVLILVGDATGTLHAFDEDGAEAYAVDTGSAELFFPVTVIDETIYVADHAGTAHALAATEPDDTSSRPPRDTTEGELADAGLVAPGQYISPNTGVEVQWDPGDWELDPFLSPPVATSIEVDELHLTWAEDDTVWLGVYVVPSYGMTMDEVIAWVITEEEIEAAYGPKAEVVLSTSTPPRGAMVVLDTSGFGPWMFYSEFYMVNDGTAIVEVRLGAPATVAEDSIYAAQQITLGGQPLMTYYPVLDVVLEVAP